MVPSLTDGVIVLNGFTSDDIAAHLAGEDEETARRFGWWPQTSTEATVRDAFDRWAHSWETAGPTRTFERQVPFRPDWEHVITPIVDFLLQRPEVDAKGLALYGISQAGYWVPRALAFEHRIAAAVADPGVDDVASSWRLHLPQELLALLDGGGEKNFNAFMDIGMQSASPRERQEMEWRAKRNPGFGLPRLQGGGAVPAR